MGTTNIMEPFAAKIDFTSGRVSSPARLTRRRLSDLAGLCSDRESYTRLLEKSDPVVYEVYEIPVPQEEGHLLSCTTVIYPGMIGREYYFTKGHFHTLDNRAEIYTCLRGAGYLLMATRSGESRSIAMSPCTSVYIPPHWSHRTLNCGNEPFIFHGVWPADAGHDYRTIAESGFPLRVFEENGTSVVRPA